MALLAVDLAWPGRLWPATLLSNVRHLLVPLFAALAIDAAVRRRPRRAVAAAAGVLLGAVTAAPWFRSPPAPPAAAASGVDLRIVTINLGDRVADGTLAARELLGLDADVVVMQEVGAHHRAAMEAPLRDAFPHQAWRPLGLSGKAVLSRHPIDQERWSEFPARVTIQEVRVLPETPGAVPLRIVNVKLSAMAAWTGLGSAGFDALEEFAVDAAEGEVRVVAGDLNTSPWGAVVRRLEALGLRSSYSIAGRGPGHTFPVLGRYHRLPIPPSVRIDYVLVGAGARPVAAAVGPDLGGDHLPMTATLRVGP